MNPSRGVALFAYPLPMLIYRLPTCVVAQAIIIGHWLLLTFTFCILQLTRGHFISRTIIRCWRNVSSRGRWMWKSIVVWGGFLELYTKSDMAENRTVSPR